MALDALESDTISRGMRLAKEILTRYGELKQLNQLYDSVGGVKSTVTQDDLNSVTTWSGLTKEQLDDGMFVLTATIRTALDDGLSALTQLAARADAQAP